MKAALTILTLFIPLGINAQHQVTVKVLGLEDGPSGDAFRKRVVGGQNVQLLLQIPEAKESDGPLLDPNSVTLSWCGKPIPTFTYYRLPSVALVFGLLEENILQRDPSGSITLRGSFLDEPEASITHALPLELDGTALAQLSQNILDRRGRLVRVVTEDDQPIAEAFVFGQRRKDLLTRTDEQGWAILDLPARNSSPAHYAWAPGLWAEKFDPLTSSTVTLLSTATAVTTSTITAPLVDSAGRAIPRAIAVVNHVSYQPWCAGIPLELAHPEGREVPITILAPGFPPRPLTLSEARNADKIVLESLPPE